MSKVLEDAVTHEKDDSWTFQCPGVEGSPCGEQGGRPFRSSGWPTKKVASARGAQHFDEHTSGEAAPSLDEFRAEHGLVAHDNGTHAVQVQLADLA